MKLQLDEEVRAGLEACKGDWKRVVADTGVSYSWISQFVNRRTDNPGYATLCKLHDYLTSQAARQAA